MNPKNDASDIAAALTRHGFEVLTGIDLDKPAFDRKVRDFAVALEGSATGVFFYAGHGLQVAGVNYLVPIDAQLTTPAALEFEMVRLDVVHRVMERQTNTNIIFLDACRDNPKLGPSDGDEIDGDRARLGACGERDRHADQLLDAARKRGARRQRPQLALCGIVGEEFEEHGGRPRQHSHCCTQ